MEPQRKATADEVMHFFFATFIAFSLTNDTVLRLVIACISVYCINVLSVVLESEQEDFLMTLSSLGLSDKENEKSIDRVRFKEGTTESNEDISLLNEPDISLLGEQDIATNSTSSVDTLTGQDIMPGDLEKINMRSFPFPHKLEKSTSEPNLSLETPITRIRNDLKDIKSTYDHDHLLKLKLNSILSLLKDPKTLTLPLRVHKFVGQSNVDATWCNYLNQGPKPYVPLNSSVPRSRTKLAYSKSFRLPKSVNFDFDDDNADFSENEDFDDDCSELNFETKSLKRNERSHSIDWLLETNKKEEKLKLSQTNILKPLQFTWLPSLVVGKNLNNWSLNTFKLSKETNNRPLTWLLFYIARKRDWFHIFGISEEKLNNFCFAVESAYHSHNPYHNVCHAADVVNSVYFLLTNVGFGDQFDELTFFTAIISAAVHDVNHPGKTARYLIHIKDDLSLRYHDISILEQMHIYETFKILQKSENNILENLTTLQFNKFRKLMISAIFATDLVKHLELLANVKADENYLFLKQTKVDSIKKGDNSVSEKDLDFNVERRNNLLVNLALKLSDVAHASKECKLHVLWSNKIQEEFYIQGDEERKKGLNISQHMDRNDPNIALNQLGFLRYVVKPLFETVANLKNCPKAFKPIYDQVLKNERYWEQRNEREEKRAC